MRQIQDDSAVAGLCNQVVFLDRKAFAAFGYNQAFPPRLIHEHANNIVFFGQIDGQAQRLAEPATARQFVRQQRVETPVRRKQQNFVRRLNMQPEFQFVAVLEFDVVVQSDMPFDGAYPAFFGQNNGNRFFFDHGFDGDFDFLDRARNQSAAFAQSRRLTEFLFHYGDFGGNGFPAQSFVNQQSLQSRFFLRQSGVFVLDLHFFQFAQGTQTHIQNGIRLNFRQVKRFHQARFGVVFFANNADDFVQVQISDKETFQNLHAVVDFFQAVR